MSIPILRTKLHIPPSLPDTIKRPRLIAHLNSGLHRKLTLISAPAGSGKTTITTSWLESRNESIAWLSLDERDADVSRFLSYLVTALQTIDARIGKGLLTALESPQLPPMDMLLTPLLNDIEQVTDRFILVLDDYHVLESTRIDEILIFLLDNLPQQMHIVITGREDPQLPLARLRARRQLTEMRAAHLRFTLDEASEFLKESMGLNLSADEITALEKRTEGWIVGLQLAAVSMQNQDDTRAFIDAFSGSHQYILDYLVEEVLSQQSEIIHDFLLQTSILEQFCADLCDAVTGHANSQEILNDLLRSNLFLIPLDYERKWFRYHHLFGDLLRERLQKHSPDQSDLHHRASIWYQQEGFELDAFQHAVSANDLNRAAHLVNEANIPLYFRGAAPLILRWLETLSTEILNDNPSLLVIYGWVLMISYQNSLVEPKLKMAESLLQDSHDDNRDLKGQIAALRAMLAANLYQTDDIIEQSQLALELLNPKNLYVRTVVMRSLAIAYQFRGERTAARETYLKTIELSEASNNRFTNILARTGLGIIQLSDNQLIQAEETFLHVIELVGEPSTPIACAAYLRLARIYYEWNELDKAQQYAEKGVELAHQIDTIDSAVSGEIFLAKLKLIQGDLSGAESLLSELERVIEQRKFEQQIPALIEVQVRLYLKKEEIEVASRLAYSYDLPLSQARVLLTQQKPEQALDVLENYHQQIEEQDWVDERLKVMLLQALAYQATHQTDEALNLLQELLSLTKSNNFMRLFVDEGKVMQQLLSVLYSQGFMPDYTRKLCSAFDEVAHSPLKLANQALIEPLSERELEILQLVADGLSNSEISERLYLALSTVKGHNRNIYGKLGVSRRTEAVALARELGLLEE